MQVSTALTHLLNEGYDPANITIVGDSVGGLQVVSLLGHLIHPHPDVAPVKLSKPVAGATALSAWLCYGDDTDSWRKYGHLDVIAPVEGLKVWSKMFDDGRTRKDDTNFFEPALAPASWWKGLDNVSKTVLMAGGAQEGMIDDILTTKKAMETGAGNEVKVEFFAQDGVGHNEGMVEIACGEKPGPTGMRMLAWLKEVYV